MLKYVGKRITGIIPTIILISIFVFMFVRLIPGDPARLVAGDEASYETVEMIREELGLNKPVVRQYIDWVSDIFHGDLGNSIKTGKPVTYEISLRYHNTLRLAGIAIVWGVALGLLIGIWAGTHRSKWQDYTGMTLAIAGQAVPNFWIGLMLIMLFSVKLRWFPVSGSDTWKHMVLPVLTLGTGLSATIARFTRSSIIEAMKGDYTRTARAKGLSESTVIWKHVFRNSMISVVTVVGLQFGHLLGGSVLVEAVFGLSGLGSLMVDSINNRDYFMIQALILIFALNFVVINLLVDLLYAALNPEISYK
ncbi:MAG: ABC transporter permease [Christensenellaceae bacterium]|nr:ABC transporter permease [Christensenellaceae bacterium]MCI7375888.1 ABC transporter permease [Christensenellaceae bacterium]MDD6938713.1 ABC transporter permease [Christensenellaceae bacterium]MDY2747904.1 ABC transporter permease [Eubacteriales bacterium]MDY3975400.1 ABC transporter permease [Eubacteriales bacterium]